MYFKDRTDAGKKLADLLGKYKNEKSIVFALPRGGVVVGAEIAKALGAPLDLVFARKIGHPYQPEYAVAAVSESGHMIGSEREMLSIGKEWIEKEKQRELQEIKRRRRKYLKKEKVASLKDVVAIIVDDGIATGLTVRVAVLEVKSLRPKKIVVAVPVSLKKQAGFLEDMGCEFVGIEVPNDYDYLGSVGSYYDAFDQVEDDEVIDILKSFDEHKGPK